MLGMRPAFMSADNLLSMNDHVCHSNAHYVKTLLDTQSEKLGAFPDGLGLMGRVTSVFI